jgi:hypothetical protein
VRAPTQTTTVTSARGSRLQLHDNQHKTNRRLPCTAPPPPPLPQEDVAVTLRSIRLRGLEVLDAPAPDEAAGRAAVDYAFTYKRRIDERGAKIKAEQPAVRSLQRATFARGEGQQWLLVDSVELEPPAPPPLAAELPESSAH